MLYGYLCQSLALLVTIFAAGVHGEIYYNKPQLCAYACYDTISALTFGDFDPELDYIPARCSSRLAVSSVYACFDLRCSSQYTPEESFGYLEAYCQLYGPATLNGTYADVIQDIVAEFGSVENVPVVDPTTTVEIQNTTVVTPQENWELSEKTLYVWQHEMHMHHAFGWSMYVMAAGVLFLGVLHRLTAYVTHRLLAKRPLAIDAEHSASIVGKGTAPNTGLLNKVNNLWAKHVLLPATFGYRHIQPWGWCTIPTRLQSILVFVYFALNFIFCAVDWKEFPGNTYWVVTTDQFWRYFSDRTGIICFANLPLVWLFAGRNDVLLWLTGWSFSTFNVFHRYAARIATVQGILHSVGYTVIYWRETGDWSAYNTELPEQWFWTGIAATVLMSVLLGLSILPLRAKVYELFLAIHVAFSLVILIFLFLHVKIMDGEYDAYLWVCAGFWVFDRFLRLARIVVLNYRVILPGKNDPLKRSAATATYDPDGDIIRLTVRPSTNFLVGAGIHYYIYTPTASMFRLWENHPFTLGTWKHVPRDGSARAHEGSLHENDLASPTVTDTKSISTGEVELHPTQQELMFLIRPYKGMTSTLKKQLLKAPGYTKDIRILLEGPYGVAADLRQYERVLMISGGSGVTGLLAYLYEFEKLALEGKSEGRKLRFAWAAREPRFVADVVEKDLVQFVGRADTRLDFFMTRGDEKVNHVEQALAHATHRNGLDKTTNAVVSYTRPDIAALLEEEISQLVTDISRLAVVVCGPGRLADDVRREVVRAVGSKIDASRIELYEESFGW